MLVHAFRRLEQIKITVKKGDILEDFKTSNIQNTNEVYSFLLSIQSCVNFDNEPFEQTIEHCFSQSTHRILTLVL